MMKEKLLLTVMALTLLLTSCGQPVAAPTPTEVVPEPTSTVEPTPEPVATFEEAPCPFELPRGQVEGETVECGYLVVPEDRGDPDSRDIRLAVAILRHPDGAPEPDPVIYLEGGPGGSPLKTKVPNFDAFFAPVFAANRDIIVFDQRGVGLSEPALDCPAFSALYLDLFDYELDGERLTTEEILDRKVEALVACAEGLSEGANLAAYNTVANAADVNDLRIALGYDEVNLWGTSYGARLSLGVMRDFPQGVRSVVLDAPYTPEADLYLETPGSFDRALNVLFEDCAADAACDAAYPDLRDVLFETVDHLNQNPVTTNVLNPSTGERWPLLMDGDMFLEQVFRALYATAMRPVLPQVIYDASEGTFDVILLIARVDVLRQDFRSWGMYFSVLCNEEIPFSTWEAFEDIVADYPEFAGFFADFEVGGLSYAVCPEWGAGQAEARENELVTSDIPALVMTGEYDPIVPPAYGQTAVETLANGYFFEYPGVGHGASSSGDCPLGMMLAFLEDPTTMPDDACMATMEVAPFAVPTEEVAAVELEPFSNDQLGISGVAPAGWTEAGPGVFVRASSATDVVSLVQQAAPVSAADMLARITAQLGLAEAPESVGEREANDLAWTFYATEVQGVSVDIALAESDELTLLVVLNTAANERDALYGAIFLPVVDALAPIE